MRVVRGELFGCLKMALSNGPDKPFTEQDVVQRAYNSGMAASGLGTGGKYQQAIQAATAAVQGLAGGNLSAAPYIAEIIKQTTPDGAGRVAAHAVVNAALAVAQGNNALAGATGAATGVNRPGFPGECFICELRLPDHRFRWKHNKLFLLLPEEYGPAFPAIVDCYTSPPTLVWPVPLLHGFSSSYGVLPPLCKDH